jgi:hypothetical protein
MKLPKGIDEYKLVYRLSLMGASQTEIAECFGVTLDQFRGRLESDLEFYRSYNRGKLIADAEAVDSLFKKVTGFTHKETKVHYDPSLHRWATVEVDKYYAPDTLAGMYWLQNRQPARFKNVNKVENSTDIAVFNFQSALDTLPDPLLESVLPNRRIKSNNKLIRIEDCRRER